MSFQSFRRHPSRYLSKCKPQPLGRVLQTIFDLINRNDWLADIIADPTDVFPKLAFVKPWASSERAIKISVIMATRNNSRFLQRAIESVLSQTHSQLELIIIDDASSDDSAGVIRQFAARDPRITFLGNDRQLGTGASRNIGLQHASGMYVTFQDGDDFSAPDRLERQLDALIRFPEKKLCLCNYVRVDGNGNRLLINDSRVMKCIISMMFLRDDALEKVGFFLEKSVGEDAEYYERLKIAFGKQAEILVFGTLYEALFRERSSLFSSAVLDPRRGNNIRYRRSQEAEVEWQTILARLDRIRCGELDLRVPLRQHSINETVE